MEIRSKGFLLTVAFLLEIGGFWLSAQGVMRESFVELSRETHGFQRQPVGRHPEGRQPHRSVQQESSFDSVLVKAGLTLGLLPTERELTTEHRRENARAAVIGVVLILFGMLLSAAVKARASLWQIAIRMGAIILTVAKQIRVTTERIKTIAGRRRRAR